MADTIQPTPRNKLLGLLADALGGAYDYAQRPDPTMPMGKANPMLGLLADALPLRAGANVLDDLSYGQAPIRGTGMTTRLTPDATELALAAAPFPKTSGRAALAALGAVDHGALNKAAIVWQGSPHIYDAEKLVRLPSGVQAYVGGKFNAIKEVPPGATVLQDFPLGRIRSEAIGTGEGAQAYGHGSYLAEAPDVARSYKDTLRGLKTDTQAVVEKLLPERRFTTKERAEIYKAAMDEQTPVQDAARRLGYRQASIRDVDQGVLQRAIAEVREQGQGSLYKVDLPDNMIARMLDWDKPLNQQAELSDRVKPLLREAIDVKPYSGGWGSLEPDPAALQELFTKQGTPLGLYSAADAQALNVPGSVLVRALGKGDKESWKASEALRRAGIPGIRYLDGGSRGTGAGTSNFVVFPGEENALTILERNGRGLLD